MDTTNLSWMWMDRPTNPHNGVTVSVAAKGVRGYSYYHRPANGTWSLIAVAANNTEAVDWFNHRVDPAGVPADLAAWLDSVVA